MPPPSDTDPEYGKEVFDALPRMCREEGWDIYNSLPIIMLKMVPGTMSQLASYEFFPRSAYSAVQTLGISADTSQRFVISTLCAVFAGVVSTLTSQPGDTILSEVNKGSGGKKVERELREVGSTVVCVVRRCRNGHSDQRDTLIRGTL